MKPLAEMNLIDDFLMSALTCHEEHGPEAMRYILGCILQRDLGKLKVVSQHILPGADPESHGVRLDVYLDEEDGEIFDVEPDLSTHLKDRLALPKRVRFYHAKIDETSLKAGAGYQNLRNVIVIFITPYDPFERGRMVYTMKTQCQEDSSLPYEDGSRTIFLYTRGSQDHSSPELAQLLHYIEDSRTENACTEELLRLDRIVNAVKSDRKVGYAYMKSWERDERNREEGRAEGEAIGRAEGLIETALDLGLTKEDVLLRLQDKLGLSEEQAQEYMERYGR